MLKLTLLSSLLLIFLISCGVGEHEAREENSLYFSSSVNGIDYKCGKREGVSKTVTEDSVTRDGVITCVYSPLVLSLGSLELGTIENFKNRQIIYPQDLVPSFNGDFDNPDVLKIAILLESLLDKKKVFHPTIVEDIKEKITLDSLSGLSISQLYEEIRKLGITPITEHQAKIHLISNSNSSVGKPVIRKFEEDISICLPISSVIGRLSFATGRGTIIPPLILSGEGSDKFLLNSNGKLHISHNLEHPNSYKFTVTVNNEFGSSMQKILLHVKDSGKIGKAQMGRLSDSTVQIFRLNPNGTKEIIHTSTTKSEGSLNQIGNFELKTELLEDQEFYLYEISGGVDVDSNDDGVVDQNHTQNRGKLRLLSKGIWIKNAMHKVRVTPLSEMLYSYVEDSKYSDLERDLNRYSRILLSDSLDEDSDIDAKDIIIFDPLNDKKRLYPTLEYNNTYTTIVDKIRAGDSSYREKLFSSYIVDSFKANAVEIVGSYIYTVDMLGSGEFAIYDLNTKEKVSSLKLPNTPYSEDSHVIYVNLLSNTVMVSSLDDWAYEINIKNLKKPFLVKEPFIHYSIVSGNFSRVAIGRSDIENIFSISLLPIATRLKLPDTI